MNNNFISSDRLQLARSAREANRQIESSKAMIDESVKLLASLKNAKLEMKYFVECSFDYLYNSPATAVKSEPDNNILYFNRTDNRPAANE